MNPSLIEDLSRVDLLEAQLECAQVRAVILGHPIHRVVHDLHDLLHLRLGAAVEVAQAPGLLVGAVEVLAGAVLHRVGVGALKVTVERVFKFIITYQIQEICIILRYQPCRARVKDVHDASSPPPRRLVTRPRGSYGGRGA